MTPYIPGYQPEPIQFWHILYVLSIAFSGSMCCWGLVHDFFAKGLLKSNKAITIMGICGIGGFIAQYTFPWGFFVYFATLFTFLPRGAAIVATLFSLWCFYLMVSVMFPETKYGY